jgi:hypothetical protein
MYKNILKVELIFEIIIDNEINILLCQDSFFK